jgi:hypothetical protein
VGSALSRLYIRRQLDGEGSSLVRLALDAYAAAVGTHQLAANGQPQAAASTACVGTSPVATPEAIEDVGQILGWDAFTGVAYDDANAITEPLCPN